jgi:hypothetical protein
MHSAQRPACIPGVLAVSECLRPVLQRLNDEPRIVVGLTRTLEVSDGVDGAPGRQNKK